jgi:hypothetical protein
MIAATLVEDVVTAGADVADDAASIGVASGAFEQPFLSGLHSHDL